MLNWGILLSKKPSGAYEICVRFPGVRQGGEKFVRRLPPDFSDFLKPSAEGIRQRTWRRPPGDQVDEALLFCAGDLDTLKDIGTRLHEALFKKPRKRGGDLTGEFLALREAAALGDQSIDVRIDLTEAPELARIPWESLYLAADDLFLGIDAKSNIVRILAPDRPGPLPPPVEPPMRMLVAVANPMGELETGTELADIRRRLDGLLDENCTRYELRTLPEATRSQFGRQIEDWKPHIVHFIGHGGFDDERGLIYFHDERDPAKRDAVDSATLRDLVRNDRPWLVVLNSCLGGAAARADPFGGAAQNLIRINVPFVVAMQSPISDEAAVRFSQRFYASLMRGDPIAAAVTRGRNAIRSLGEDSLRAELITPVLYSTGAAQKIEMAPPAPVAGTDSPPPPLPPGVWRSRIAPTLPTLNNVAGILSAVVAVATLYMMIQTGGDESRPEPAGARSSQVAARLPAGDRGQPDSKAAPPSAMKHAMDVGRGRSDYPAHDEAPAPAAGRPANAAAAPSPPARPLASLEPLAESIMAPPTKGFALVRSRPSRSAASAVRGPAIPAAPPSAGAGTSASTTAGAAAPTGTAVGAASSAAGAGIRRGLASSYSSHVEASPGSGPEARDRLRTTAPRRLGRRGRFSAAREPAPSPGIAIIAGLELAALRARNGAEISLPFNPGLGAAFLSGVASQGVAVGAVLGRATSATETYLLTRGVPRDSLKYRIRPRSDAMPVVSDYGAALTLSYPPTYRGRPVSVLASFPAQSSAPLAVDIDQFVAALSSPSAQGLAVELVGRADSAEAATSAGLAGERAERVAGLIRESGIAGDRIRAAGSSPPSSAAASSDPALDRRVDGRLVVKGAERIGFAAGSTRIGREARPVLDSLASLLQDNPELRLHFAATREAADDPRAGKRLTRIRKQFARRGVGKKRIETTAVGPIAGGAGEAVLSVEVSVMVDPHRQASRQRGTRP